MEPHFGDRQLGRTSSALAKDKNEDRKPIVFGKENLSDPIHSSGPFEQANVREGQDWQPTLHPEQSAVRFGDKSRRFEREVAWDKSGGRRKDSPRAARGDKWSDDNWRSSKNRY